jgi:hypothetical protein
MPEEGPALKLHLEPSEPIEVGELTAALGALSRQYLSFVVSTRLAEKSSDARLLVSSVSQGSIDISMLPDLSTQVTTGVAIAASMVEKYELVEKFAGGCSISFLGRRLRPKKPQFQT